MPFPAEALYPAVTVYPGPARPLATTIAATGVGRASATLKGTVNPDGIATTYYFEYGTSLAYGFRTASASAGSGQGAVSVSHAIVSLRPGNESVGTTYHFRVIAESTEGESIGEDLTFTTLTTEVNTIGVPQARH